MDRGRVVVTECCIYCVMLCVNKTLGLLIFSTRRRTPKLQGLRQDDLVVLMYLASMSSMNTTKWQEVIVDIIQKLIVCILAVS